MKNNLAVSVINISKHYKSNVEKNWVKKIFKPKWEYTKAVDNISFEIKSGDCVAFLGPNGAGKTTTTKMLTGLVYPTSGEIKVLGYTPQDREEKFLKQIGLVMGNKNGLNWDLTAKQSFTIYKEIYELSDKVYKNSLDKLAKVLFTGNWEQLVNRQVRKLSLGERMKMELIAAVLHQPRVLFLDEPTIGLDITSKKAIRNFIRYLNKETETTVILTSHDMDDIEHICDRVIVINHGKIVFDGDIGTVKTSKDQKLEDAIEKIFLENEEFVQT